MMFLRGFMEYNSIQMYKEVYICTNLYKYTQVYYVLPFTLGKYNIQPQCIFLLQGINII